MFDFVLTPSLTAFLAISLPFVVVPMLIALVDFVTVVRAKYRKVATVSWKTPVEDDYSILIPIFGHIRYLKNVDFLKPYGDKVVLCTTTKESKAFNASLKRIAKKNGFRIFRSEVVLASKKHKPNPWKLFMKTLHASDEAVSFTDAVRDEIIRDSFAMVQTKYCIFLDGDTVADKPLNRLVGLFARQNLDLASVRVLASKTDTMAEKMQSIEYQLAMDARKVYPWLTSGASMVARTEIIKDIMQHHSLFFSGGDIEIGKLASMLKFKVGHIPFVFYTDVPETFRAWFKQRMAWFGGGFRHAIINSHSFTWRHPMFFLYTTFIVYLLTPVRWYEAIKHPEIIPVVIAIYWLLIFGFHWKYRRWYFILFPIYALVQVMIVLPFGVFKYFQMAHQAKNIGFIRLRHPKVETADPLPSAPAV